MLTKTKSFVRIPRKEWDKLKNNPNFTDLIELLEDRADLKTARGIQGEDLTLKQYLKKRGIRNNS